jgi:hypothetical protein
MSSNQGALPWSPVPTFLRQSLASTWQAQELPEPEFKQMVNMVEQKLNDEFAWESYQSLEIPQVLEDCNGKLDSLLQALNLNRGRSVQRIKNMTGLTRLLGLSYGGPAFHDPLTGEVAWVSEEDNPAPRHWRFHAVCHELVHAKGFTREMDAETLTQLVLLTHHHPGLRITGYIHFLKKTGEDFTLPRGLETERKQKAGERKQVRAGQPLVRLLTRINKKFSIQNDPKKYGYRKKDEPWNPNHPFFSTVMHILKEDSSFFPVPTETSTDTLADSTLAQ